MTEQSRSIQVDQSVIRKINSIKKLLVNGFIIRRTYIRGGWLYFELYRHKDQKIRRICIRNRRTYRKLLKENGLLDSEDEEYILAELKVYGIREKLRIKIRRKEAIKFAKEMLKKFIQDAEKKGE